MIMKYKVTNNYTTLGFNTLAECYEYINNQMKKNNIKFKRIYNRHIFTKNKLFMQVIIYQYQTLYMETFIIHEDYNLAKI